MIQLSIIVPCEGIEAEFERTLVSVLENRPRGCEVIVPCHDTYADPYDLSDEVRFVRTRPTANLVDLLNAGFLESRGTVVHWVVGGVLVPAEWANQPTIRLLEDHRTSTIAPILVNPSNKRILSAGVKLTYAGYRQAVARGRKFRHGLKLSAMGPDLWAGFCKREVIFEMNGLRGWFGEDLSDVDLAARLHSLKKACLVDSTKQLLCHRASTPSSVFSASRRSERLFWKNLGTRGSMRSLAIHSMYVATSSIAKFPRPSLISHLGGRFVGACDCLIRRSIETQFAIDSAIDSRNMLRLPEKSSRRRAA